MYLWINTHTIRLFDYKYFFYFRLFCLIKAEFRRRIGLCFGEGVGVGVERCHGLFFGRQGRNG